MRTRLTTHAARDVEVAHEYYAGVDPELGERFADDVEAVIERLETFPNGAPPVDGFNGMRRARPRQFPYGVFYQRPTEDQLLVVRVLHTHRDHRGAMGVGSRS